MKLSRQMQSLTDVDDALTVVEYSGQRVHAVAKHHHGHQTPSQHPTICLSLLLAEGSSMPRDGDRLCKVDDNMGWYLYMI